MDFEQGFTQEGGTEDGLGMLGFCECGDGIKEISRHLLRPRRWAESFTDSVAALTAAPCSM